MSSITNSTFFNRIMIPQEIVAFHVFPFLASISDIFRLSCVSKFLQEFIKKQDQAQDLPRTGRIVTFWEGINGGGFEPLSIPKQEGLLSLCEYPFYIDTFLSSAHSFRGLKPYLNFQVDICDTFFKMNNGTNTPLEKFRYRRAFIDHHDENECYIVTLWILKMFIKPSKQNPHKPLFLVGWCTQNSLKSPILFGCLKNGIYEITTAGEKDQYFNPPPIISLNTEEIPYTEQGSLADWNHIRNCLVQITLFGLYES